jgi:hypothetical protein
MKKSLMTVRTLLKESPPQTESATRILNGVMGILPQTAGLKNLNPAIK